ncbi:MAG: zinc ribbon domain-containing protein [Planctomycetes bacterium]|nr:zinc ribbon domain-containing protein [Planctomycetota bacterium]
MPMFDYRCQDCGEIFEFFARRRGEEPQKCPSCGSTRLEKEFSSFGVGPGGSGGGGSSCQPSG